MPLSLCMTFVDLGHFPIFVAPGWFPSAWQGCFIDIHCSPMSFHPKRHLRRFPAASDCKSMLSRDFLGKMLNEYPGIMSMNWTSGKYHTYGLGFLIKEIWMKLWTTSQFWSTFQFSRHKQPSSQNLLKVHSFTSLELTATWCKQEGLHVPWLDVLRFPTHSIQDNPKWKSLLEIETIYQDRFILKNKK